MTIQDFQLPDALNFGVGPSVNTPPPAEIAATPDSKANAAAISGFVAGLSIWVKLAAILVIVWLIRKKQ